MPRIHYRFSVIVAALLLCGFVEPEPVTFDAAGPSTPSKNKIRGLPSI
jgi:hypothetical protein